MDKRYQVFISSTYQDLHEERQEIIQALLELDCIPAGMELFPAANDDQWTLIKRVIDDCDYYIVVIGGRYGSIGPSGLSYTQMEYEYAVLQGKPVIAFLHRTPETLPSNRCEHSAEGKGKLDEFRSLVQKKMCKYWLTPADLGSAVSRSLVKLIKDNPAVGWVKADLVPDENSAKEILHLTKKVEELQQKIDAAEKESAEGTENFSQGNDTFLIRFSFAVSEASSWQVLETVKSSLNLTWDDVFSIVSPLLIDEAPDSAIKATLDRHILSLAMPEINKSKKYDGLKIRNIEIDPDDFNTIKVQLLALKLMGKSTKKKTRGVNDRSAYWALTAHGERTMTNLRAIKKS